MLPLRVELYKKGEQTKLKILEVSWVEFLKTSYSAIVVLIILKLWQTVVIVIHFICIAKSPKPVEPLITFTEELKCINVIFTFHIISLLLFIIVYKNQNHKLIAEKNELSKTLEVEKKISKMKTMQIESGDTNVFNILKLSVFSVQVKKRTTDKSINFRNVYIYTIKLGEISVSE